MKLQQSISLLLLLLMGAGPRLAAQSPEELLPEALAHNRELLALKKEYQAALERAPQVSQLPHPELGVGVFVQPVETRLGPQRGRVGVTQMFPWFGTLQAREQLAQSQAMVYLERIAALELELRFQLEAAYYQLYELAATERILEENLRLLTALRTVAEAKVAAGNATVVDVLRLDLDIEALTQRIQVLANHRRGPLAQVNQILYRELDAPVTLPDTLPLATLSTPLDSVLQVVAEGHPLLRLYQRQQAISQAALLVNERQGLPSLGLGADYFPTGPRQDLEPIGNGRDAFQLRATISIPLYRKSYRARAREEQLRIDALEDRQAQTLQQFAAELETAYAGMEEARLDVDLYQRQLQTVRRAIQVQEADYSAQARGFDDLLQLERRRLDYQLQLVEAVVRSHRARAAVQRFLPF